MLPRAEVSRSECFADFYSVFFVTDESWCWSEMCSYWNLQSRTFLRVFELDLALVRSLVKHLVSSNVKSSQLSDNQYKCF